MKQSNRSPPREHILNSSIVYSLSFKSLISICSSSSSWENKPFHLQTEIAIWFEPVMCGRSACTLAPEKIKDKLRVKRWENEKQYQPMYNISPAMYHPVMVLDRQGQPYIRTMKWGKLKIWMESTLSFSLSFFFILNFLFDSNQRLIWLFFLSRNDFSHSTTYRGWLSRWMFKPIVNQCQSWYTCCDFPLFE